MDGTMAAPRLAAELIFTKFLRDTILFNMSSLPGKRWVDLRFEPAAKTCLGAAVPNALRRPILKKLDNTKEALCQIGPSPVGGLI